MEDAKSTIYAVRIESSIDVYVLNHYELGNMYGIIGGCQWQDKYWIQLNVRDVSAFKDFLREFKYEYIEETIHINMTGAAFMTKSIMYSSLPFNIRECVSYRTQKVWDMETLTPKSMRELLEDVRFGYQWNTYRDHETFCNTQPYGYIGEYNTVKSANFSREDSHTGYCSMGIRLQLKTLPDDVNQFCALRYLYLACHALTDLPDSLSELRRLETLSLEDNKFTHFPKVLQKMHRLRELSVDLNPIPKTMPGLRKLQQLDLLKIHHESIGVDIKYMIELLALKIGYGLPTRQRTSTYKHFKKDDVQRIANARLLLPCEVTLMPRLECVHLEDAVTFSRHQLRGTRIRTRLTIKRWMAGLVVLKMLRRNVVRRRVDRALYECAVHEFMMRERDRNK